MFRMGLVLAYFVLSAWGAVYSQETPATPDASLRAIHMANAREGWAVGDDGLILHTVDGWETHEIQRSGVRVSLRGVHFVNAFVGFVVGSEALPYGRGTGGVVLATSDGGTTWTKCIHRELPGLYGVKFLDAKHGYAFGDTMGSHTGGIFFTDNGGKTWKSCDALAPQTGWLAGTVVQDQPVAVGTEGKFGLLEKSHVLPMQMKDSLPVTWTAIAGNSQDVWAVGTQAAVMVSRATFGKSFERVHLPIPACFQQQMDFNSVCVLGDNIWITGRPGTCLVHSPDRGKTWKIVSTGQPLPLNHVQFVDEKTGYIVGEMGTILKTLDGGNTWKVVRRGGHRSAVLLVNTSADKVPLGTLAWLGGDQGYLCIALQAVCEPGHWHATRQRLNHAVRVVGGTSAEVLSRMPVSDYQQHMETDKLLTLADNNRLLEQLVLAIRLWRPSVVISEALEPGMPSGPLASSVAWYVRQACELAGRSDVFPEQLHELKLETWQPVRLFSQRIHANAVDAALPLNIPRPVLFAAPNDFANLGRPLVCEHFQRGPEKDTYTLVRSFTGTYSSQHPWMALLRHSGPLSMFIPPGMMPNDDLMAGLSLNHGGQARREAVDTDDLKFQLLLGATWRQQMDARPYQQKLQDPQERRKFFTNFEYTLNGLTPLTIGDRIAAQAQEFVERGQWTMARECHFMLLDLMPTHRLAPESCRFIATMMTSGEIKRRVDLNTMTHFADYVFRSPASKAGGEEAESPFQSLNPKQRTVLQRYRSELRRWYGGTQVAGSLYSVMHPLGYSEPEVQFALLASERLDGRPDPLRQTALLFKETVGTWAEAAQAEEWLQQRVGECPKPCMQAVRLQEQPKIDGKLDEAVWKKVPATELKPGAGVRSGTKVRWAYDDNHLYVALECFRHQNMPMLNPVKPRKRDDDLQAFDRISLLIDIDRDYSTAYRLEFDARGCVREDCCGDVTWNPRWFVEVQPTETGWTAEVAIPLVELTGMDKLENEAWAASVTRIVPGLGLESTSLPASVKPIPGSMGLLLFGDSVVQTGAK